MVQLSRRSVLIGSAAAGAASIAVAQSPVLKLLGQSSATQAPRTAPRSLSVRDYGARGDGVSDDRPAIQAAIDAAAKAGGGTVYFPAGTYIASRTGETAVAITLKSGVTLQGAGVRSVLKLRDGDGGHLVNATRERNCGVRDMVLDGNRLRQPSSGHGFRSGGVAGLTLTNLIIRNAFHYGIGLEGGTNRDVLIKSVTVEDCGGDGIDIKNKNSDDTAVTITDVTVRRWGLNQSRDTQAAIDCRGPVRLTNIRVSEPGSEDAAGIRMRQGEVNQINGLGAHNSQVDGFDVRMGQGGRARIGVHVAARSVSFSNGTVSGGMRGVMVQDSGFRGTNLSVNGCRDEGILIVTRGRGLDGDDATLTRCRVTGCGEDGISIDAQRATIVDCRSNGNRGHGLRIRQTAGATRVVGGDFSANGAGPIADAGVRSELALPGS
ncbi:right-handed parallel beta-helix repeat-containing protein [Sphingomonas sabuli]|uniref:Right-handed parallel beta-helix repeat-containing protein n=1 Tax=Sphingomonas sabuli TaxID=2764186 RepID=A0A7G9L5B4_9SPHN|nr:right-handed parallel beta-helix repeat-containing protein [Sphingomonas sabuli]QNM83813.1 right-handed parallel beta-helix repeat-containing protein [Sphingomonas sabuli]